MRRTFSRAISTLATLALCLLTGCADPTPRTPSIVLISIDTLRSDRLPLYGYEAIETPAIDRLGRDGVVFERAYAHVPLTLPSHASMFTGLLPNTHGVRDNLGYTLDTEGLAYLPAMLRSQGYATGAAISSLALAGDVGMDAGFDVYDDDLSTSGARSVGQAQRSGFATLDRALAWLETVEDAPFFLFLHLYEPHSPYTPPEPWASQAEDPYDGEVLASDAVIEKLLGELDQRGLYDDAVIVLTSDHGEGLGDHGEIEHGILLYREALQVPMVLKLPRRQFAGRRVATSVQSIDLFPTLGRLAGLDIPPAEPGTPGDHRSLVDLVESPDPGRAIYAETLYPRTLFGWSDLGSVIVGDRHLIGGVAIELYDLVTDPGETEDLFSRERREASALVEQLDRYERSIGTTAAEDLERVQELQSLGYLMGGSAPTDGVLLDPKTQIHRLEDLRTGMEAFGLGDFARAESSLRLATAEHPTLVGAWSNLAVAVAEQGRRNEALEVYRRGLVATGGSVVLAEAAARHLIAEERFDEASDIVATALAGEPGSRRLESIDLRLLLSRGDFESAARRAREIAQREPTDATAAYDLSLVARVTGNTDSAEEALRRTLTLDPDHLDALNDLAVLLGASGRLAKAIPLLRRALEISPGHPLATENLRAFESRLANPAR